MHTDRTRSSRALSGTAVMAIAIAIALVATACNSSSDPEAASKPGGASKPEASCAPRPGLSALTHESDAAVVGTVTSVATSAYGPDPAFGPDPAIGPDSKRGLTRYRTATLDVEEVLWSSEELPAEPGKPVTVTLFGDGSHTGDEACWGYTRWNDIEGPITKGRRVLLLFDSRKLFPGMKGYKAGELGNWITDAFYGNWTVRGDRAVNVIPERGAPLDALVARLVEAHDAPADYDSRRGVIDPLEATEPVPPTTEPTMPRMPGAEEPTETPEGESSAAPTG